MTQNANPSSRQEKKPLLFSVMLGMLALATVYLAWSIGKVANYLPELLPRVDRITEAVPPVLEEAAAYRELAPEITAQVAAINAQIPAVLAQVQSVQQQVAEIQTAIPQFREQDLPALYRRVDRLQEQLDVMQQQLPAMLETVNNSALVLAETNRQIDNSLAALPGVLAEVKAVRTELPVMLDQAQSIIVEAEGVSEEAGKSMFKGVLKGIVTTPFDLLMAPAKLIGKEFGNSEQYTEVDLQMMFDASKVVLSSDTQNVARWRNPESKAHGEVQVIKVYQLNNKPCKLLRVEITAYKKKAESIEKDVCLNTEGKWQVMES